MVGEVISAIASCLILSSTFPQFYQTVKTRLTRDLSIKFLFLCVSGQVAWVVYAVVTYQPVFIVGEGVDMGLWAAVLIIAVINVRRERFQGGSRIKHVR